MKKQSPSGKYILSRNEAQWSVKLLRQDLEDLRREQNHLRSKRQERSLTQWESQRVFEISREIIELLRQFCSLQQGWASETGEPTEA